MMMETTCLIVILRRIIKIKLSEVNKNNLYKFPRIIIESDLKCEYEKKTNYY